MSDRTAAAALEDAMTQVSLADSALTELSYRIDEALTILRREAALHKHHGGEDDGRSD